MEKWLDLLTPSAAALALLLAVALVVQAIRHGRAQRRLESRLAEREGAAARVSLDRLSQLQRRAGTSSDLLADKTASASPKLPPMGTVAAVMGVLALVGGTTWYLFLRGDGEDAAKPPTTTTQTSTGTTTAQPRPPGAETSIPETPAPLPQQRSAYTVLVLNGSGVTGAAANLVPVVQRAGWATESPGNASTSDEKTSFVVYLPGNEDIADNLAKDLGIRRKLPKDGVEIPPEAPDVDVIVVIGLDLATSRAP